MNFKKKIIQNPEKKEKKKYILKNLYAPFNGRERVLDAFESKIFPIKFEGTQVFQTYLPALEKISSHSNLKILTPLTSASNTTISTDTSKSRYTIHRKI